MNEICKNCKYKSKLKHNFAVGKGFEESFCCIIFVNEKDGFILEVQNNDYCEMFEEMGGEK